MNNLSDKVLQKISKNKLKSHSRIYFLLKWWFLRLFIFATFLAGALILAIMGRVFLYSDISFGDVLSGGYFAHFIKIAGLIWVALLVLLIAVLRLEIWVDKYGYRLGWIRAVAVPLIAMILFAGGFYATKSDLYFANNLNKIFTGQSLQQMRVNMWHQPEKGLLVGSLLSDNSDYINTEFKFIDIEGRIWSIQGDGLSGIDEVILDNSPLVVIAGNIVADDKVFACAVKPIPTDLNHNTLRVKIRQELQDRNLPLDKRRGFFGGMLRSNETNQNFLRSYKCGE